MTSIHVYSLAPHAQRDLTLLSDVSKSLAEYGTNEDAAALSKKYGTIYNPNMRKRSRNGPPPVLSQSKAPAAKAKPIVAKPAAQPTAAAEAKVKQETAASGPPSSSSKEAAPPSTAPIKAPKKASAGGIMSSFAKTKPPKPKPEPKKEEEDTPMSDDGEADDADVPAPKKASEKEVASLREAKKEREDALKRMMEEDDEEEEDEDKDEEEKEEEEEPDEEMTEAPEPEPESEPKKEDQEPAEVISSTESGRRRGKRRVMKKKRIMDDKGYMGKLFFLLIVYIGLEEHRKLTDLFQSRFRKPVGSPFPKTKHLPPRSPHFPPRPPRRRHRRRRQPPTPRPRSRLGKLRRETSCRSSPRNRGQGPGDINVVSIRVLAGDWRSFLPAPFVYMRV